MSPDTDMPINTSLSTSLSACSFPSLARVPLDGGARSIPTNLQVEQSETPQDGTKFMKKDPVQSEVPMRLSAFNDEPYQSMMVQEMAHCYTDPERTLVSVVLNALTAHEEAWVKARFLYRDISCGNIMLVVDQEKETETVVNDILNGWDLYEHERDLALAQTPNSCSGTWAFMSGMSLKYPLKPYQLSDDLEAFIHVVTFCCLRFHWHDMSHIHLLESYTPEQKLSDAELRGINGKNEELGQHVATFYYACYTGNLCDNGVASGGRQKIFYARNGILGWELTFARKPLKVLLKSLYELLKTHHKTIDFEKLEKHYFAGEGSGILSTIEEGFTFEDNDSDGGAETDSATSDPFTKKSNPGQDLNTHSRTMSIFQTARDSFRDIEAQGLRPKVNDKSPDQFRGLYEWSFY